MVDVVVVDALPEHVERIAANMRSADVLELQLSAGKTPTEALELGLRTSTMVWTGMIDGQPEVMFGVAPISLLGGIGSPWLLGTDEILRIKRRFIIECRRHIKLMLRTYPYLTNHVHSKNVVSKRWLKWLGFSFGQTVGAGVTGEPFTRFEMRAG